MKDAWVRLYRLDRVDRARVTGGALLPTCRPLSYDRTQRERPRQGNGRRIEAHLVIARLIVERARERERVFAPQGRLRVRMPFEHQLLNEPERLLVHGHTLVEGLEEVDLRLGVLERQDAHKRLRRDGHADDAVAGCTRGIDVDS